MAQYSQASPMTPPHRRNDPFVFVSYSHKDKLRIEPTVQWLTAAGFRVWNDEHLPVGSDWAEQLAAGVRNCSVFLVFLSENAIASDHVKNEIHLALEMKRPYHPILLDKIALPDDLLLRTSRFQALPQYELSETQFREKLLRSLPLDARMPETSESLSQSANPDASDQQDPLLFEDSISEAPSSLLQLPTSAWRALFLSMQTVPAMRYALATVGLIASIALIKVFLDDNLNTTLPSVAIMLVSMVGMLIFAYASSHVNKHPRLISFFLWSFSILLVATALLTIIRGFFGLPAGWTDTRSDNERESTSKPVSIIEKRGDAKEAALLKAIGDYDTGSTQGRSFYSHYKAGDPLKDYWSSTSGTDEQRSCQNLGVLVAAYQAWCSEKANSLGSADENRKLRIGYGRQESSHWVDGIRKTSAQCGLLSNCKSATISCTSTGSVPSKDLIFYCRQH